MIYRYTWFFLLLGGLFVSGCGGARPEEVKHAQGTENGVDSTGNEQQSGMVGVDQSTGNAMPSGPGVSAPERHVMSPDAKVVYNEGVRAAASGDIALGQKSFKQALSIDPKAFQAMYNLGVAAERLGNDDEALRYYKKCLAVQPDYMQAIKALAMLNIRKKNISAAVDLLKSKSADYPKNILVLTTYADVLIAAKRYQDAIDVAKMALKLDERYAYAMVTIANANYRLKRFELAQSIFDQVLAINPDIAEVYFTQGLIALEEKNRAKAIEHFNKALEKAPYFVEALNDLAIQYILAGNYEKAIAKLNTSIALTPSWGVLYLNYGNALRGAGKWKEAQVALDRAIKQDSSLISAFFNLGLLYYVATEIDGLDRLSRLKEAQKYFVKYKQEKGSSLTKNDPVYKYLKEVSIAIEREERRIEQAKEQAKREEELAKQKAAKAKAKAAEGGEAAEESGKADENDDEWEDEDEGWE
jgi:tetratricopeptide (TPR) repeat protein